jgi:hypothetical protein
MSVNHLAFPQGEDPHSIATGSAFSNLIISGDQVPNHSVVYSSPLSGGLYTPPAVDNSERLSVIEKNAKEMLKKVNDAEERIAAAQKLINKTQIEVKLAGDGITAAQKNIGETYNLVTSVMMIGAYTIGGIIVASIIGGVALIITYMNYLNDSKETQQAVIELKSEISGMKKDEIAVEKIITQTRIESQSNQYSLQKQLDDLKTKNPNLK